MSTNFDVTIPGLINGTEYGVRVYERGQYGWQTSPALFGLCTPMAGIPIGEMPIATRVRMNIDGKPWNWLIVHQGLPGAIYDASCDGTWALSEQILENHQWHSSALNAYENSDLHVYQNGMFLNRLDVDMREAIKQVRIPYRPGTSGRAIGSGANGLLCKVFALSGYEMGWTIVSNQHFLEDGIKLDFFDEGTSASSNSKRIAYRAGVPAKAWLRSANASVSWGAWGLGENGSHYSEQCVNVSGFRPTVILPPTLRLRPVPNADGSYNPIVEVST